MKNTIAICESIIQRFDQRMSDTYDLPSALNEIITRLSAAEAKRDAALLELQQIRTMLDDGDNGNASTAIDMVKRLHSAHYELRRQLEQAQRKIAAFDKAQRALDQALNEGDGVYRP